AADLRLRDPAPGAWSVPVERRDPVRDRTPPALAAWRLGVVDRPRGRPARALAHGGGGLLGGSGGARARDRSFAVRGRGAAGGDRRRLPVRSGAGRERLASVRDDRRGVRDPAL